MRILVVDDHAATRKLLERNLQAASHGVKLAGSCAQATSAVAVGAFDVVHDAFHNVAFFDGGVSDVPELVARDP